MFFLIFQRTKVSKEQLAIIIKEKGEPHDDHLPWDKIAKILNDKGPCVKSDRAWKAVKFTVYFLLIMN